MSPKLVFLGVGMSLALLAGCQKKQEAPKAPEPPKPVAVEVVKETERSRNFLAVNKHLELGGTLYAYVDIDGDVEKLTSGLHDTLAQMASVQPAMGMAANQDFTAIAKALGLTDIKAIGISSVPDGTGFFRNRAFFYTPGERHGLLLGLGGKPGPLTHVNLAPADTAFFSEADVDVPVVYRTVKEVVTKVAGEQAASAMEGALKNAGQNASISVFDLINGLKGRSAIVMRMNPDESIQVPGGVKLPAFSLLLCVDAVGQFVEPALTKSPLFKRTEEGTLHVYTFAQPSPVKEIQPVIVVDGTTLFFATTRGYFDECHGLKSGLAQTPEFQQATASIGVESNGLTYVHPRLFDALRKFDSLNPSLPPQMKSVIALVVAKIPKISRPMAAIRTNLPDGILVRTNWDRSLKQEVAMIAVYNPVSLGLVAAMAIPAFQKVRASSQEKAVMNNLRQLSSAADQYYLEHGVTTATYEDLVGPDKYVRAIRPVAGEDYTALKFESGKPLQVTLQSGKVVQYPPEASMAPRPQMRPRPKQTPKKAAPQPKPAPETPTE